MSFLQVPKQGRAEAAPKGAQGWPWNSGAGQSALDQAVTDVVVAQARVAERAAGQVGALKAYMGFEQSLAAEQAMSRRPVHNERFLGNTLKQVGSHNQRVGGGAAAARLLGSQPGAADRRRAADNECTRVNLRGRRKVKAVFEKEGTLGIYFEESTATG